MDDKGKKVSMAEYPAELGPVARQEWDRIRPEIEASELAKPVGRGTLIIYCVAYALCMEAAEAIQKYGAIIKAPSGYPMPSPYVAIFNQQAAMMTRIACEFGFTPLSHGRLRFPIKTVWRDSPPEPDLRPKRKRKPRIKEPIQPLD